MYAEVITSHVTSHVAAVVAADAVGEVYGDGGGAGQPQSRDQLQAEIRQTVRDAIEGARQGTQDAGRAAADAQRFAAEVDRARAEVARAQAQAGGSGNVSITRDGNNNVVIHMADGKTITLDPSIVPPPAIEGLVASLAPPPPPPVLPNDGGPPERVIELVGLILGLVTVMVLGVAWARAFARRGEARAAKQGGAVPPDTALRLERIEQAVDAMAVEMERVSEAQRYAARLLTERLPEPVPQLAAAHAARTPHDRG